MASRYGWLILVDKISEGADKGVSGPRGLSDAMETRLNNGEGRRFWMDDDDGVNYYIGRYIGPTEYGDQPLFDFGMPNAGCTEIRYSPRARFHRGN